MEKKWPYILIVNTACSIPTSPKIQKQIQLVVDGDSLGIQ